MIDVLRAFTVSAFALAGGAREVLLVATVEEARRLGEELPGALVSAEVGGLPVAGVAISNSPTVVSATDLGGRVLVQRSTSGVQAALAARSADAVLAGSLVVASATASAVREMRPPAVTLVATGAPLGHREDRACADVIEAVLAGRPLPPLDALLAPVYADERYQRSREGRWPGCPPTDMDLALALDTFDFAMRIEPDGTDPARARLSRA